MNMILLNLVCSDLSVSIIGNPITLTASIFQGWIFGRTMCKAYGFFMALLGEYTIHTFLHRTKFSYGFQFPSRPNNTSL